MSKTRWEIEHCYKLPIKEAEWLGQPHYDMQLLLLREIACQLSELRSTLVTQEERDKEQAAETNLKESVMFKPVTELELSTRADQCLRNARIETIGELVNKTEADLLRTKNLGKKSLTEIRETLRSIGLFLRADK